MQQQERQTAAVLDNPAREAARVADAEAARRNRGGRDLVGGTVLIGIGFLFGSSVFTGNPTILDWVFDGLGTFWIAKGIYLLSTSRSNASA